MTNKEIVKSYLIQYFDKQKIPYNLKKLFICHFCKCEKESASIQNNRYSCYACQTSLNIFGYIRKSNENMKSLSEQDIADFLVDYLDITVDEEVEKLLAFYKQNNWALIPLTSQGRGDESKRAIEKEWQNSCYKDPVQWMEWIKNKLGIAVKLGKDSGVMLLEFDDDKTYERLKDKIEPTLRQKTNKGYGHLYYKYDPDFYKTINKKAKIRGWNLELRVNGAYGVIAPTSTNGEKRSWDYLPIIEINQELKEFLLKFYDGEKKEDFDEPEFKDLKDIKLNGLEGCCDDTMISIGGAFRKIVPLQDVKRLLPIVNNILADPLDITKINSKLDQLEQYNNQDNQILCKRIYEHLQLVKEARVLDLKDSLREDRKKIEEALDILINEEKIFKSRSVYRPFEKPIWAETLLDNTEQVNFKMPYFDEYAKFRWGDLIVIGASPGVGKTTIAMNIIKKLKDQNIKPDYISLESGSRFKITALKLGLVDGDFRYTTHYNPQDIELENNKITILDWLLPDDFTRTDLIYKRLSEQLSKHGGILIVFVQLKKFVNKQTNEVYYDFFAPQQLGQFPSFVCKYDPNGFTTNKIRESKRLNQEVFIPTEYNHESCLLELKK